MTKRKKLVYPKCPQEKDMETTSNSDYSRIEFNCLPLEYKTNYGTARAELDLVDFLQPSSVIVFTKEDIRNMQKFFNQIRKEGDKMVTNQEIVAKEIIDMCEQLNGH